MSLEDHLRAKEVEVSVTLQYTLIVIFISTFTMCLYVSSRVYHDSTRSVHLPTVSFWCRLIIFLFLDGCTGYIVYHVLSEWHDSVCDEQGEVIFHMGTPPPPPNSRLSVWIQTAGWGELARMTQLRLPVFVSCLLTLSTVSALASVWNIHGNDRYGAGW